MIVDKINAYLTRNGNTPVPETLLQELSILMQNAFKRQFGPKNEKKPGLRLSSIGQCVRKQAYSLLGFEENGKSIDSRAKMVFFQGDLAECSIIALARQAGLKIRNFGLEQTAVFLSGVEGHPDGILELDGEEILVECKSMSSYSFKEFEKGILEEAYELQIQAYLAALGLSRACVVALNKDAGVLAEQTHRIDHEKGLDILNRIKTLRASTKENLPARPYAPDEKGHLPWQCLYCAYWQTCWPEAQQVLVSNRYKLKIIRP
jgi:hypothetical protein